MSAQADVDAELTALKRGALAAAPPAPALTTGPNRPMEGAVMIVRILGEGQ